MTYHLAGDSTVESPVDSSPMSGWGGALAEFVDAPVENRARGGATTQSFIDDGLWRATLDALAPGDTVVIQFGHNDQKDAALDSRGGYSERLRGFIADVRARGGSPVLCTSCERRWFEADRVTPTHGDYPNAVRDLAAECDVPLIDLTAFTMWLYEDLGDAASRDLFCHFAPGETAMWPDGLRDDTHFRRAGARRIAAFVARSLRAIERQGGDAPARGAPTVA
ncbi:rhamnogalacturonan acetylesterase [Agromyces atrinae]|uniref:Lysophospholipase L1-like esterase n=1 Tax=Agromyces atrinae TaxID=592376 RepID=A0A4Q2M0F0_9MICO|nr:rhamnogalacturonan acetylesterase [Agromyces atrinae]NYD67060.1 lysophospholipase L1-like esterase [Agromyces atrinae]RXZ85217.1 rhamnogalacturonan acetylesterase [Agromyces atrinae]RXZ85325.1 rhamnogalacturonan acetylesterase [Agromyces atrinae]